MQILRLTLLCAAVSLATTSATLGVSHWLRQGPRRAAPARAVHASAPTRQPDPADLCRSRREAVFSEPAVPGAPGLDAVRAELVARAKAEPVLFVDTPRATHIGSGLARWRERLYRVGVPWQVIGEVFSRFTRHPTELREILLTDGYLYAEKPDLAALLASGLSLSRLYTEREVDVTRGAHTWRALRKRGDYVWADGPEAGQPAKIWLFDRLAVPGEPLGPPKHIAVGDLHERLGATRIDIEHVTRDAVVATLEYGELRVPALLAVEQGQLRLECEAIAPEERESVEAARSMAKRRQRVVDRLRAAVAEQVGEGLPFDEPKTEEGQQDGRLRLKWRDAYFLGRSVFEFNGDQYLVFGPEGVPRIPQVCVDFITDTWERMAGTRWAKRNEGRHRQVGRLDFDTLSIENRRSVDKLIDFAVEHPDWFELMLVPASERVAFANRGRFFRRLLELRAEFRPGDVVAILGPRDDDKLHYHSFFIVQSDPLTAMPTLLAGNAGRPRIRNWEGEMQNAPRRSIVARIRPRLEWLEQVTGIEAARANDVRGSEPP
jgi:hypothetical protein